MGIKDLFKGATSYGKQVLNQITDLSKCRLEVGFSGASYPDGTSVADVAMWNEYGTSSIPARPFISTALKSGRKEYNSVGAQAVKAAFLGEDTQPYLDRTGQTVVKLVQKQIESGSFAPNAPSTVKRKGSNTPLLDSGLMKDSVVVQVVRK